MINKALKEADNLLLKLCERRQSKSTQESPERKKRLLIHNQDLSYAAALSQNTFQAPIQLMEYSLPFYRRPVSISFTPNPTNLNKAWFPPYHNNVKYKPKLLP